MPRRSVVVGSAVGLHARPAALIAEKAGSLDGSVTVALAGSTPVDAASALMIMTLGAKKGAEVVVSSDDEAVLGQIAGLVARRILCYTRAGDTLARGQRFGFIRFGSRVDVYLPPGARPKVSIGDRVSATTTVLAEL